MPAHKRPQTLLVAFNRIGDLTLSIPLFRAIGAQSELSLLTRPFGPALLGGQSYVADVYALPYPNRGHSWPGKLFLSGHRRALGRVLADRGFDEILIYETERDVIRDWLHDLFPGRVREMARPETEGLHALDLYRTAAESLDLDMLDYPAHPSFDVDLDARVRAQSMVTALGDRVIGIQTGSQRTHARRFPAPRPNLKSLSRSQWTALAANLLRNDDADALAFHGANTEAAMVDDLIARIPDDVRDRCHNMARGVGLELLPAVLAEHRALISVDTGTAHIAAAVGCPLLVFFGPTDPAVFAPRGAGPVEIGLGHATCQFCHGSRLYKTCRDNRCLNRLENRAVLGAWERLRGTIGDLPVDASERSSVPDR